MSEKPEPSPVKPDASADRTCPRCNGPMPSPASVYELQPNGVPRNSYVCRHCMREWLRNGGRFVDAMEELEHEPARA